MFTRDILNINRESLAAENSKQMHNLYAALGIHTEIIKHSRGVNCILIQTVQSVESGAN